MVVKTMTTNLWFHFGWILLLGSALILILSIILSRYDYKRYHRETKWFSADYYFSHVWSFIIGVLTIVGILCGLVYLPVTYLKRTEFYASEEVEYQNAIAYHDSLIDALNHTDVLDATGNENFGLYAEVRNYNMQAAKLATAYKSPSYSIWFKHSQYNWSTFPQITIP